MCVQPKPLLSVDGAHPRRAEHLNRLIKLLSFNLALKETNKEGI